MNGCRVFFFCCSKKLFKNEIFVHHIAVGGDTNRSASPWPVSPLATFSIIRDL